VIFIRTPRIWHTSLTPFSPASATPTAAADRASRSCRSYAASRLMRRASVRVPTRFWNPKKQLKVCLTYVCQALLKPRRAGESIPPGSASANTIHPMPIHSRPPSYARPVGPTNGCVHSSCDRSCRQRPFAMYPTDVSGPPAYRSRGARGTGPLSIVEQTTRVPRSSWQSPAGRRGGREQRSTRPGEAASRPACRPASRRARPP
jgi:hypothetical protein